MTKRLTYGLSAASWLNCALGKYVCFALLHSVKLKWILLLVIPSMDGLSIHWLFFLVTYIICSGSLSGALSKWCSCNDPCTHDWHARSYWSRDAGDRTGNAQVLYRRIWSLSFKRGLSYLFQFENRCGLADCWAFYLYAFRICFWNIRCIEIFRREGKIALS